jgi:hypothetical protein
VDRGSGMTARVADPRRWAAFHCFGVMDLLLEVHAAYEDVVGALDAGQLPVARYATRELVLRSLAVRALKADGLPVDTADALADPFTGVPAGTVAEGLGLARALARADDIGAARALLPSVEEYVRRLERELGYHDRAPSVRRPEGLFPALRMARQILRVNRDAGLPPALPAVWMPAGDTP